MIGCESYHYWATRMTQHNTLLPFSTRGMFAGGLRETQQKEIAIHGVSYMAMKKILDYIYTSEIDLDPECVQEVLIAATLVQVGCCSYLFLILFFFFQLTCAAFVFSSSRMS